MTGLHRQMLPHPFQRHFYRFHTVFLTAQTGKSA